jgi:hypothetical protein
LRGPDPVSPQGVVMVQQLLSDGAGPLYFDRGDERQLAVAAGKIADSLERGQPCWCSDTVRPRTGLEQTTVPNRVLALFAALSPAASASGLITRSTTRMISAGHSAGVTARCPFGRAPAFGGFSADLDPSGRAVPRAMRLAGSGWRVSAFNDSATPRAITAHAYCSKRGAYVEISRSVEVAPENFGAVTVKCPGNKTLRAGGFAGTVGPGPGPLVYTDLMRRGGRGSLALIVAGFNSSTAVGRLTAHAYCGHGRSPVVREHGHPVPSGGSATAAAKCPRHNPLQFGGFSGSANSGLLVPSSFTWGQSLGIRVEGVDRGPPPRGKVFAIAFCADAPRQTHP